MGSLGRRLPAPRFAQHVDVADGLGDRGLEIGEVDRLREEVEGAAIHRRADIGHVAIGRDDDGRELLLRLLELGEQRQPVHARHVDVREHHVDAAVRREHRQGLDPVMGEEEGELALADLLAEFLEDERLEIGLVVDDEDPGAESLALMRSAFTQALVDLGRSAPKSIGFVIRPTAPPSSALAARVVVAIGGDHDHRHVRTHAPSPSAGIRGRSCPAC